MIRPLSPGESWLFLLGVCVVFGCLSIGIDYLIGGLAGFMDRIVNGGEGDAKMD